MKKIFTFCIGIVVITFMLLYGCDRGDENVSLAPYVYQDGFEISPNPAPAFSRVTFFFPYYDHDGNVKKTTVFIRLETDGGDKIQLSPKEGTFKVWGDSSGAMSFELEIKSQAESQGTYYISIVDEAGNRSNEISEYLFVNPPKE